MDEPTGTAIEKYFFTPLYYPRSAWSVVAWWEKRRPLFNAAVGAAGLATLGTLALTEGHPPPFEAVGMVLVYGVLANICYTLGSVVDLSLRRLLGDRAPAVGPVLFRYGFVFSVGLTMLPIPLILISKVLQLLFS